MVAVSLDVVTFCSHLLAEHLQTVVARFVHFARLALGAEVAVAGRQFIDDTVESKIAIACRLLALHNSFHFTQKSYVHFRTRITSKPETADTD